MGAVQVRYNTRPKKTKNPCETDFTLNLERSTVGT